MARPITAGDRVAYSANWLRSTGQMASADDIGGWRGTVESLETVCPGFTLATVVWDSTGRSRAAPRARAGGEPIQINILNLARIGTPAMSAQ